MSEPPTWLALLPLLLLVLAAGACFFVLLRLGMRAVISSRNTRHLPATVDRITVTVEPARLAADHITDRVWTIPLLLTNNSRTLAQVPTMLERVQVWTKGRPRRSLLPFQFFGILEFEPAALDEAGSMVFLNPQGRVFATATVTMPAEHEPAGIQLHTIVSGRVTRALRGRLPTPSTR